MKKVFNNKYFTFILGIVIASSSIVLASGIVASEIGYTPTDVNFTVSNVSEALDTLYIHNDKASPVGEIINFMGTYAPDYYLACDGAVYNVNDYPELANHFYKHFGSIGYFGGNGTTTFAVPDLRGEFLRGTGTNSHTNQGSGLTVGTHQDATIHYLTSVADNNQLRSGYFDLSITNNSSDYHKNEKIYFSTSGVSSWEAGGISYTSRPTNTSVMYLIRYK